ncbi:MAG: hypothetical protein LBR72_03825 [Oscillospiraceae bacterium]|jgi:hypothetical protein|nr:hypothetical protein [Oscillospiraceae bacterium]
MRKLVSGLGLTEEAGAAVLALWDERERLYDAELARLREEAASPLRAAGLVPAEGPDGLPSGDPFLAGLGW